MTTAFHFPMLDRLLDDVMTGVAGTAFGPATPARGFTPALDVRANAEEIVFTADVPGIDQNDLEITLDDAEQAMLDKSISAFEGLVEACVKIVPALGA